MDSTPAADTPPAAAPWIARIPLSPERNRQALVIVHADRATRPAEGLQTLLGFHADGQGGWISAAQADDGRWGLIDAEGRWRLPPTLENARGYSVDGLARFQQGGLWGFVDLAGAVAMAPRFLDVRPFRHGLSAARVGEDEWRILDREGRFTSEARFHHLSEFGANGLACATPWDPQNGERLHGFVDRKGRWVIAPRFQAAEPFDELEVTPASVDGDLWGLIDAHGEWVLTPNYALIDAFNGDGLAYCEGPDDGGRDDCAYLDAQGRVVVQGDAHLARYMACGRVAGNAEGSRFLCADGTPLATPALAWGTHFRPACGFAVVRTRSSGDGDEAVPGAWGLLHTDGRVLPVDAALREPLTDAEGWIPAEERGTPLVPFITRDGQVAWIDGAGAVVWRAVAEGAQVVLQAADGRPLWRSAAQEGPVGPLQPFFHPQPVAHQDAVALARGLLADAEAGLHGLAAGAALEGGPAYDEEEEADEDAAPVRHAVRTRRLARTYLGEEHSGHYEFLGPLLAGAVDQAHAAVLQALTGHHGPPVRDPEHKVPWWFPAGHLPPAWAVPMDRALPGDSGVLRESREQWLSLYKVDGTGDGDAWWELWLMAAPSVDALQTAQRARQQALPAGEGGGGMPGAGVDGQADASREPQTREEWLQTVASSGRSIGRVPAQWLDDATVDAAVADWTAALEDVPARFQTPERLAALVHQGVDKATQIPPRCMTAEGLALARALYAGQPDWDGRDQEHSRVPRQWNHNSLYGVWAGLLTPAMALAAVRAHAPLRSVAHWLRTDAVEEAALSTSLDNIRDLDPARITPALAEAAVRYSGDRISAIPAHLLTPQLCLMAVRNNGQSLALIPEALRSVEVCVAALQESWNQFMEVPAALRVEVTTQLIDEELAKTARRKKKPGTPDERSEWHANRAWAKLWAGDWLGAIADAQRGAGRSVDMHYVQASAWRALGRRDEAAQEAANVLARESPYIAMWNRAEDTRWLKALAQEHTARALAVDDAALVELLRAQPDMLGEIPRERITHAMVDAALQADERTVRFVPRRLLTPERYAIALERKAKQFGQIPVSRLTEAACIAHVRNAGWNLGAVPQALRTLTVCAYAVRHSARAIEEVPEALRERMPAAVRKLPRQ